MSLGPAVPRVLSDLTFSCTLHSKQSPAGTNSVTPGGQILFFMVHLSWYNSGPCVSVPKKPHSGDALQITRESQSSGSEFPQVSPQTAANSEQTFPCCMVKWKTRKDNNTYIFYIYIYVYKTQLPLDEMSIYNYVSSFVLNCSLFYELMWIVVV